jgi:hypothetical protein
MCIARPSAFTTASSFSNRQFDKRPLTFALHPGNSTARRILCEYQTPLLPLVRAHIARRVRGREILMALNVPHDSHGSELTAQPGRPGG